jgi:hypothetical protein
VRRRGLGRRLRERGARGGRVGRVRARVRRRGVLAPRARARDALQRPRGRRVHALPHRTGQRSRARLQPPRGAPLRRAEARRGASEPLTQPGSSRAPRGLRSQRPTPPRATGRRQAAARSYRGARTLSQRSARGAPPRAGGICETVARRRVPFVHAKVCVFADQQERLPPPVVCNVLARAIVSGHFARRSGSPDARPAERRRALCLSGRPKELSFRCRLSWETCATDAVTRCARIPEAHVRHVEARRLGFPLSQGPDRGEDALNDSQISDLTASGPPRIYTKAGAYNARLAARPAQRAVALVSHHGTKYPSGQCLLYLSVPMSHARASSAQLRGFRRRGRPWLARPPQAAAPRVSNAALHGRRATLGAGDRFILPRFIARPEAAWIRTSCLWCSHGVRPLRSAFPRGAALSTHRQRPRCGAAPG